MRSKKAQDKLTSTQAAEERALWKIVMDASDDWKTVAGSPRETPRDVAEVLSRLHQDAEQRVVDLKPRGVSPWVILALVLVFGVILAAALVLTKVFIIDADATKAAAANTANQAAMETSVAFTLTAAIESFTAEAVARNIAAAKTETAEALAGDVAAQAAGTKAAELTGTAEQAAVDAQSTQTAAQAKTAAAQTQTAEAARCQNVTELSLASGTPKLQPEPGTFYVTGDAQSSVEIRWPVTNTSPSCAWNSIKLIRVVDKTATALDVNVFVNGQLVVPSAEPIAPGTTMIIVLPYVIAENVVDEWFVQINGQARTSWRVAVNIKGWVFSQTPTPTPTVTPLPTLTPPDSGGGGPTETPKPPDGRP